MFAVRETILADGQSLLGSFLIHGLEIRNISTGLISVMIGNPAGTAFFAGQLNDQITVSVSIPFLAPTGLAFSVISVANGGLAVNGFLTIYHSNEA